MRTFIIAVGATLLLLTGCGSKTLAERDPEGYAACSALIQSATTTDTPTTLEAILEAGKHAQASTTKAIRDASSNLVAGAAMADPKKLRAACSAEGIKVPAAVTKSS